MDRIVGRVGNRISTGVACSFLVAAAVSWSAAPARAVVYSNSGTITIPAVQGPLGSSDPYPSTIAVSGSTSITDVNVTLTGVTHQEVNDIEVLLVGPTGQNVQLMGDAGGLSPISGLSFTFDDSASASLSVMPPMSSGTYRPTTFGVYSGTAPAPAGPYGATLSVFNGTNPNGIWNLYVNDDFPMSSNGTIAGWSLNISTAATVTSFAPATGAVGDAVTITGSGFTGVTAVMFGSTPAATFTAGSDTQITATVPAGAGTGPISVTTPLGSATSATGFVVSHARHVFLTVSGERGKGRVDVVDGFGSCASGVPVTVQHLRHHKWHAVAAVHTLAGGKFKATGLDDPGKYRAVAKKTTLSSGDVCGKAVSSAVRIGR